MAAAIASATGPAVEAVRSLARRSAAASRRAAGSGTSARLRAPAGTRRPRPRTRPGRPRRGPTARRSPASPRSPSEAASIASARHRSRPQVPCRSSSACHAGDGAGHRHALRPGERHRRRRARRDRRRPARGRWRSGRSARRRARRARRRRRRCPVDIGSTTLSTAAAHDRGVRGVPAGAQAAQRGVDGARGGWSRPSRRRAGIGARHGLPGYAIADAYCRDGDVRDVAGARSRSARTGRRAPDPVRDHPHGRPRPSTWSRCSRRSCA